MNQSPKNAPLAVQREAWTKRSRKAVYRQLGHARDKVAEISPHWLRKFASPIYDYFEMIFIDHGMFRSPYANRAQISPNAWRSSQPWPHQLRYLARKKGIKTVVNLRGPRNCGSDRLERKTCDELGITMRDDLSVRSRGAPEKQRILKLKSYFESLEYPILLHCKAGADRASLVSVLYLHLMEDVPIEEASKQLSLRFGHFKQAKTGILDYFFEQYLDYSKKHDITFIEWVETVYDEEGLMTTFQSSRWSNVLVDKILMRE